MKKKYASAFKWGIYALFLILAVTLQTTPTFAALGGFRPVFVIPLAICVAMLEGDFGSAVYGCIIGYVWDVTAGKIPGFSAFLLLVICLAVALSVAIFVRINYLSCIMLSLGAALFFGLVEFFFFYVLFGYDNLSLILLQKTLPQAVSSAVVSPLIFFAVKRVHAVGVQKDG